MAPGFPPNRRRLKRHWRPALLALCVLAATSIGASFAMPKVEAAAPSSIRSWDGIFGNHSDARNKGSHHGFWVTAMPKKCDELFLMFLTEEIWIRPERCWQKVIWGKIPGCGWYFWDDFTALHPVFKCFKRFSTCSFKNKCLHLWLKPGHRLFTRQISSGLRYRQRLQVVVWHMSKQWSRHSLVLMFAGGYIAQLHIDCKISMNVNNGIVNHFNFMIIKSLLTKTE